MTILPACCLYFPPLRPSLLTGTINILLWLSYIVMLSLYSYAFDSYGAALFSEKSKIILKFVLISASIVGITGLNLLSAKAIGEAEEWILTVKVGIRCCSSPLGFGTSTPSACNPNNGPPRCLSTPGP